MCAWPARHRDRQGDPGDQDAGVHDDLYDLDPNPERRPPHADRDRLELGQANHRGEQVPGPAPRLDAVGPSPSLTALRTWGDNSARTRGGGVDEQENCVDHGRCLLGVTMIGVPTAEAVTSYRNCDALHRRWEYGVAKSQRAARRQVRTDHDRPTVSRAGYQPTTDLDADKDGTACEVSR